MTAVQTELENLPPEWDQKPLGMLINSDRGISYGIVQPGEVVSRGVRVLRVDNVQQGRISTENAMSVSPEVEARHSRTRLRGGELLLTVVGANFGKSAVVPRSLAGWNVARAVAVIPVLEEMGSRWVHDALERPFARRLMDVWANTTAQPTLNLGDVAKLPIPLPDERERTAILTILGALDDKIEINRKMNQTLEQMTRALFKSWFVDFDPVKAKAEGRCCLPGFLARTLPG